MEWGGRDLMAQGKGKAPEATCPMCGSALAKSPAGAVMMHTMAQMGKRMQGGGPQRGMPMKPGMPMRGMPGR